MSIPSMCKTKIDCKQRAVRTVRFNVDGSYCLTCGSDKSVKLWNPHKGLFLKTYMGHGYEVLDAQSSCDNSQLVSCGKDKTVILWDVASGEALRRLRGHAAQINCIRLNEESTVALSGSLDGSVRCWDLRSRSRDPIQVLKEAKDSVTSIRVNASEIFSASVDGKLRKYDLRNGEMITDDIGEPLTCVCLSRDGQSVLVSCQDAAVRLMDKGTGEMLAEYKGHESGDLQLESCLDHTDALVVSASANGSLPCWDLVEGQLKGTLDHGGRPVTSLQAHPSMAVLLTACSGELWVWQPFEDVEASTSTE